MAGGGGGNSKLWIWMLVIGGALVGAAYGIEHSEVGPTWLRATLLAAGGLAVVFGSCESMIKCVEGIGKRLGWNEFVAGTIAGLAANLPEVVMIAFVIMAGPRVAFVVIALTLHVGALAFGIYSAMLPRDARGEARMPKPLVKLSTDLYACAAGIFLATGLIMLIMRSFETGNHRGEGLGATDLYVIGAALLLVQITAISQLIKRFSGDGTEETEEEEVVASPSEVAEAKEDLAEQEAALAKRQEEEKGEGPSEPEEAPPSVGAILGYGILGIGTSVIGGDAVGDFAEILVEGLTSMGYSEMVGAIFLSIFACAGGYAMIATAHMKKMYDVALANVSGAVTQQPFVVLPIALIMTAAFSQLGIVPTLPNGGVLAIDLQTTSVVLLAFPPMLILWKSVQDDGKVNWLETASMVAVFGLVIYFLAAHGE